MRINWLLFPLLFILILFSCSDGTQLDSSAWGQPSQEEFAGLEIQSSSHPQRTKVRTIGNARFEAIYKPTSLVARSEVGSNAPDSLILLRMRELEGLVYFDVKISLDGGSGDLLKVISSDPKEYDRLYAYCAFGASQDFMLIGSQHDTIPCSLMHYEHSNGLMDAIRFVLGFDYRLAEGDALTLIFRDRLLNNNTIKFIYSPADLVDPFTHS